MRQFFADILRLFSYTLPPHLKDKLLAVPLISYCRDFLYKGAKPRPFKLPGLPWPLYLLIDLKYPGERLFVTRNHEPHVVRWAIKNVKPGWIVLDIGAFIGFYTVIFGRLCGPEGRVIAFEPLTSLRERILLSAARNNLSNVIVETLAVGAANGEIEFYVHEDLKGGFGTSSSAHRQVGERAVRIRMVTVDQYVEENHLPKVDLIKIDVEGGEIDVLRGAQKTLEEYKPILLLEFNTENDYRKGAELVGALGYTLYELGKSSYGVHVVAEPS